MAKFGELLQDTVPILLDFYTEWHEQTAFMSLTMRDVAAALGDKAKVVTIDVEKNKELATALKITDVPTLMIYKNGILQWRQSGVLDANTLIGKVMNYN